MNKVLCPYGHYYDGDKYQSCPHCASGIQPVAPSVFDTIVSERVSQGPKEKSKEKHSLFKRKSEPEKEFVSQKDIDMTTETLAINNPEIYNIGQGNVSQKREEDVDPIASVCFKPETGEDNVSVRPSVQLNAEPEPVHSERRPEAASTSSGGMQPYHQQTANLDEIKTLGFFSTKAFDEPPTGYLICIKGKNYGIGFPLKTGNNTIGRSQTMDIVISDPKVSRDRQAYIMYEPKKREFFFKPGEGNGLCYVNDELVMEHVKIKDYDKISLGDTELFLLTVCNEKFSWDELENNK